MVSVPKQRPELSAKLLYDENSEVVDLKLL